MTVNPGWGGQDFIETTLDKVRTIRAWAPNVSIEVDGGVNQDNADRLFHAGADVLVAGNAVFKAPDPKAMIHHLKGITLL